MKHLVGGISSAGRVLPEMDGQQFVVSRADGPFIWDGAGHRYVDTGLGFGATVIGHSHPVVLDRVYEAIARGSMPAFAHELEEAAAAALASHTGTLSKVVFVNTGSEAVHLACRAARAFTGRGTVAKFAAGYDGWFDEVAFGNANSQDALMSANSRPTRDHMTLLRFNDKADAELLFAENPDIAAILVEPVLANAGCILPEPGYLEHLVALARANGALVIMDEVLMGFRLHAGLTCTFLGIEPDLVTVGKAIGSGFVVAAVLGRPEVMRVFEERRANRAGTYNGNPVACAAVCATMEVLESTDFNRTMELGDELRRAAELAFAERGTPVCSTGYGTVFTLWKGQTPPTNYAEATQRVDPEFTLAMHFALRRNGVISMPAPFGRHYLSSAHGEDAMGILHTAFTAAAYAM